MKLNIISLTSRHAEKVSIWSKQYLVFRLPLAQKLKLSEGDRIVLANDEKGDIYFAKTKNNLVDSVCLRIMQNGMQRVMVAPIASLFTKFGTPSKTISSFYITETDQQEPEGGGMFYKICGINFPNIAENE